jgi:hypothetical protein
MPMPSRRPTGGGVDARGEAVVALELVDMGRWVERTEFYRDMGCKKRSISWRD